MLPSFRELILDSAVLSMEYNDEDELSVCTNDGQIHIIDLMHLKHKKNISLTHAKEEKFDYYKRPLVSGKNLFYSKPSAQEKESICPFKTKEDKATFNYSKNENIVKACFSNDEAFLLTGTEEGKTNLIDTQTNALIFEFPFSADSISALAFSDDNRFALSASFDKNIKIVHVNSLSQSGEIKVDSIVEKIDCVGAEIFLAITRNGNILKIDAKNAQILETKTLPNSVWPSELRISFSRKFAYIGTRSSQLFALHVESMEIVYTFNLNRAGITSMLRTAKYFIIGYNSGEIQFFNHRENEDDFILHIKLHEIQEAKLLFEKNIFLMTHRETKKIYDLWLERKDSIVTMISSGLIEKAQELARDFLFHPKCKQEMESIEALQPDLAALQRYIRSTSYNAAYELTEAKPQLKDTLLYEKLEYIWKKALQKAQILLSRDPILNIQKAKEALANFLHVGIKKEFIQKMLSNTKVFIRAEQAVKNKNFILYFNLANEYDFLEFTPLYKKVMGLAQKIKLNVLNYLKEDEYMKALESLKLLAQFFPFKENAKNLEQFISSLMVIDYHIEHDSLFEAIEIQNKLRIHATYKPIQKLNKMKILFIKKMVIQIQENRFQEVFDAIEKYFSIKICIRETAMLMKQMYIEQMKKALKDENTMVDWEKSIIRYGEYFNIDMLIEDFYEMLDLPKPLEMLIPNKQVKKRDFTRNILVFQTK